MLAFSIHQTAKTRFRKGTHINNKLAIELLIIILVATAHGFAAAWLAVRMLFRPRHPIKLFNLTIWPQGMIPRHKQRLAETIGRAVGEELVSQETVIHELFDTDFFKRKTETLINGYRSQLLGTDYPSVLGAFPPELQPGVKSVIHVIQLRLVNYVSHVLKTEETATAVTNFVSQRIDEVLSLRLHEALDEEIFDQLKRFVSNGFHQIVTEADFENKVRRFVSARIDDLAASQVTLGDLLMPEPVRLIKERIDGQIHHIVHQLAEIATSQKTRTQIAALITREVDTYYSQLSFFRKFFISRELVLREIEEMINNNMPRRVEEYLLGKAFAEEARAFISSWIDSVLARPIQD
ncbi:MAG: DUF445 family protein, partial [Pyrinomonadaceae bacterium]